MTRSVSTALRGSSAMLAVGPADAAGAATGAAAEATGAATGAAAAAGADSAGASVTSSSNS